MNSDLSFVRLISDASPIVQFVLLALLTASVLSWSIMLRKRRDMSRSRREAEAFEGRFWSGGDLGAIYQSVAKGKEPVPGLAGVFEAGFREFRRLGQQPGIRAEQLVDGARRAMRVAEMRDLDRLEENLSVLATIGSTSPYVGLFGTVWGIMNSFVALGNVRSATLGMVAPGIAEALVATAMGLFAAIPAVIAYNRFADRIGRLELRYDTFIEEFAGILHRNAHSLVQGRAGKAEVRSA